MHILPVLFVCVLQTLEPGDSLVWQEYPIQRTANQQLPTALFHIETHLPSKYGVRYQSKDLVTWGHETTHGINSELKNTHHNKPAFFHPPNISIFLDSPKITIADAAERVPTSLRGSRYNTYLVQSRKDWNDYPLYLFDEWTAYCNGALVGLEIKPTSTTDIMVGPLEFSYYALSLCLAIEHKDPEFAKNNRQFREFVAYELKISSKIWSKGSAINGYNWKTNLKTNFLNNQDTAILRDLVVRWYGQEFFDKYMK